MGHGEQGNGWRKEEWLRTGQEDQPQLIEEGWQEGGTRGRISVQVVAVQGRSEGGCYETAPGRRQRWKLAPPQTVGREQPQALECEQSFEQEPWSINGKPEQEPHSIGQQPDSHSQEIEPVATLETVLQVEAWK